METSETAISVKNLNFSYNSQKVLDDINIDIKKGEFLGLIGPNGSGKSTFLKLVLGLLPLKSGSISIFGQDINSFKDWNSIGYVPQKAGSQIFDFPITVTELVSMGLIGEKNSKTKIDKALKDVEVYDLKGKLMNELSGGQQQRVFIARALVSSPKILILDEPTSGVDLKAQESFYNLLKKLNKEFGITLILVSHDIEVVVDEVTSVMCLNGKLICHLTTRDFVKKNILSKMYDKNLKHVHHHHES